MYSLQEKICQSHCLSGCSQFVELGSVAPEAIHSMLRGWGGTQDGGGQAATPMVLLPEHRLRCHAACFQIQICLLLAGASFSSSVKRSQW